MNMSALLEVVIGLAAVFWLASSLCSFAVEAFWSMLFNVRAKALERFVGEMVLGADALHRPWRERVLAWLPASWRAAAAASPPADPLALADHPLIRSLRKPKWSSAGASTAPSYIPANTFALALLDRLAALGPALELGSAAVDTLRGDRSPLTDAWKRRLASDPASDVLMHGLRVARDAARQADPTRALDTLIAELDASSPGDTAAVRALRAALVVARRRVGEGRAGALDDARAFWCLAALEFSRDLPVTGAGIDTLERVIASAPLPPALRDSLRPLLHDANLDMDRLRTSVEGWFDGVMDRASGWFKRNTTAMLALAGLVLAVGLNANPLRIAQDLSADPALRRDMAALGSHIVADGIDSTVAQRALFARAAESRDWAGRVPLLARSPEAENGAAPGPDNLASLQALAVEVQPLLLRSGLYAGLVVGRRAEPADADVAGFLWGICRAHAQARAVSPEAAQQAVRQIEDAQRRGGSAASAVGDPACATALAGFDAKKGWLRSFWSTQAVVWHPGLGAATQDLLLVASSSDPALPDKARRFATAFAEANAQARGSRDRIDSVLGRVTSIGWTEERWTQSDLRWWLVSIVGWLLMSLAVSFGAPFWFELMDRLVNRRSTGPKPDTAAGS